jgi:hypothetical protein
MNDFVLLDSIQRSIFFQNQTTDFISNFVIINNAPAWQELHTSSN